MYLSLALTILTRLLLSVEPRLRDHNFKQWRIYRGKNRIEQSAFFDKYIKANVFTFRTDEVDKHAKLCVAFIVIMWGRSPTPCIPAPLPVSMRRALCGKRFAVVRYSLSFLCCRTIVQSLCVLWSTCCPRVSQGIVGMRKLIKFLQGMNCFNRSRYRKLWTDLHRKDHRRSLRGGWCRITGSGYWNMKLVDSWRHWWRRRRDLTELLQ